MGTDWVHTNLGVTRRELIKRSAIVGGTVVWVAPLIQSLSSPAFAAGSTTDTLNGQDISFVALLLESASTRYRVKFEAGFPATAGFAPTECGRNFNLPCADKLSRGDALVANSCPPGVSATFSSATGQLAVALGTCKLVDFVTKCGVPSDPDDQGCEDPGEGNQPVAALGQTGGIVTFQRCTVGNDPGSIV